MRSQKQARTDAFALAGPFINALQDADAPDEIIDDVEAAREWASRTDGDDDE
jgi:hypothetical protein